MVRTRIIVSTLVAASILPVAFANVAKAQEDPARGSTVTDRPRPETDPLGLRAGSFIIFPSISVTELFRDNIYFVDEGDSISPNDEQGDFITVLSPQLLIQSDWSNHALNFFGDADLGGYAINSDENYSDWHVGTSGRIDITRDTNIAARFDLANRHESRGSPDDVDGKHPIFYSLYGPTATFTHRFNRVTVEVEGVYTRYDFEDVQTGVNGDLGVLAEGEIDTDDRDRKEAEGSVRLAYEIVPEYEAFVRGAYNDRNYDNAVDNDGFDRDSHGWDVVGGVAIDLTGITFANVFAGYRRQSYDDAQFGTVQGPSFGADITWNVTDLTTVKAEVSRTVEESTLVDASGFLATRIAASVDHELLRNLILSAEGSYQLNDYDGNAREDELLRAAVQAKYLMHRNFYVSVGYDFQNRESNFINQNYTVNTLMIRLEGQL